MHEFYLYFQLLDQEQYTHQKNFYTQKVHYLELQGKFQLDLLNYFKRYYPVMPSHKLGYVAKEKLKNQNKLDIDYKFIKTSGKINREIIELKKLNSFQFN